MDGKIDAVRRALERLNGFTYHAADNQDAEDIKTVCAALAAHDPEAIRAEARAEVLKEAAEKAKKCKLAVERKNTQRVKDYKEAFNYAIDVVISALLSTRDCGTCRWGGYDLCAMPFGMLCNCDPSDDNFSSWESRTAILADEPKEREAEDVIEARVWKNGEWRIEAASREAYKIDPRESFVLVPVMRRAEVDRKLKEAER